MSRKRREKRSVKNQKVENGLAEACGIPGPFLPGVGLGGGFNPWGFPSNQGAPWTQQVSDVGTVFNNLRFYLISNDRQILSEAYVELGLVRTICDAPVYDALRGGIEIKSKELSEAQVEELLISVDRDDDLTTVGQASIWSRLFGGAGILILTDQDPQTPIELSSIKSDTPLEFRACDLWELFYDRQNVESWDPSTQSPESEFYNYYGEKVHKSRVMRIKGMTAPSFIRPRLRGWGYSVFEQLVRSINQYLKATDLGFEVLDEFKVDIYKIKGLTTALMSPLGTEAIQRRLQIANAQKNYNNALVMDSEDDWDHKQLNFAGLSDAMQGIRMQVASDMQMPMLKLFGTPATGLNASDEQSIEVYNSMVESQVRNKIKYDILRMLEIKCQKLFGLVPEDLSITFKPLKMLSAEQEENVKTSKFNRLMTAREKGEISSFEFREACNKGHLLDISLDTEVSASGGYEDDSIQEGANTPYDPKDTEDPGANRADTQKSRAMEVGGLPKGGGKVQPMPRSADAPDVKAKAIAERTLREVRG